jgi:hypothetical protein
MSMLGSVRSIFGGGKTQTVAGQSHRSPLSKGIAAEVRRHNAALSGADLTGYTIERRHTNYPNARADLTIYDPNDRPVLEGREMAGGAISFWEK